MAGITPEQIETWKNIGKWGLGGAAAGAAGMGAANLMSDKPEDPNDPEAHHNSLLKSMLLGASMGGVAGAGIKGGLNAWNPAGATQSGIADSIAPPYTRTPPSVLQKATGMVSANPEVTGALTFAGSVIGQGGKAKVTEGLIKNLGGTGGKDKFDEAVKSKIQSLPSPGQDPNSQAFDNWKKNNLGIGEDTDEYKAALTGRAQTAQVSGLRRLYEGLGGDMSKVMKFLKADGKLPDALGHQNTPQAGIPRQFQDLGSPAMERRKSVGPTFANYTHGPRYLSHVIKNWTLQPILDLKDKLMGLPASAPQSSYNRIAADHVDPRELSGLTGFALRGLSLKNNQGGVSRNISLPVSAPMQDMIKGEHSELPYLMNKPMGRWSKAGLHGGIAYGGAKLLQDQLLQRLAYKSAISDPSKLRQIHELKAMQEREAWKQQ